MKGLDHMEMNDRDVADSGNGGSAQLHSMANGHHTVKRYRIRLESEHGGIESRDIDAFVYTEAFGEGSLVTFWNEQGPVASFSAKLIREITIVTDAEVGH